MLKNNLRERPPCAVCGIEGILLTPFGLMCYRDGFAAASEDTALDHDWDQKLSDERRPRHWGWLAPSFLALLIAACSGVTDDRPLSPTTSASAPPSSVATTDSAPTTALTVATTTATPVAITDAYTKLREWELSIIGGLERGEISRTWPPIYASVVAPLEVLESSDERDLMLAAAEGWTRCANRINDTLTHSTFDDSLTAQLALQEQKIALALEEDLTCFDALISMDAARAASGLDPLYQSDPDIRFADTYGAGFQLTLMADGFGSPLNDPDGDIATVPFGHDFSRTVSLLSLLYGEPDYDSDWEDPDLRADCPGDSARWVTWDGLTVIGLSGEPPNNQRWFASQYFFSYVYEGDDRHLLTPEGLGVRSTLSEWRLAYDGLESEWGTPMRLQSDGFFWWIGSAEQHGTELRYTGYYDIDPDEVNSVFPGDVCEAFPQG